MQTVAVLLTVISFTLQYYWADDLSSKHAKLGITVVALCCFQLVLGVARNVISGLTAKPSSEQLLADKRPRYDGDDDEEIEVQATAPHEHSTEQGPR